MLRKTTLLTCTLLFYFSVFAQEVPEIQKSMVTKITASWCGNCGSWGWNMFSGLVEDNDQKALVIANHYSGNLINPASEAIAGNLTFSGQPKFFLNTTDQFVMNNTAAAKREVIKNLVDENYLGDPVVNAGLEVSKEDNTINVSTKTRFFQPASGAYYVGVYIIENGVISFQSNQGDNAFHKNVMRAHFGQQPFGELIMDGNISMGMEFTHNFFLELSPDWNLENLTFATIIWKKNGDNYEFINTHSTTEIIGSSATSEFVFEHIDYTIQPTLSNGKSQTVLNLSANQKKISIDIYNMSGEKIENLFSGQLSSGEHRFPFEINITGTYFIAVQTDEGISTKKFIIQ